MNRNRRTPRTVRVWRGHALATVLSVVVALVIGGGLAFAMNSGMRQLPIRKYFAESNTNAVWDWANINNRSDAELRDLTDFLYLHQVNTVYVDVGVYASIMQTKDQGERQRQEAELRENVRRYVAAMDVRGIRVFLAAGDVEWSKPENQRVPLAIQQFAFDFNRNYQPRLAGVEFDIESYNQQHFAEASFTEKELVLLEFLDLADKLAQKQERYIKESSDSNFELGFAIPYWYDNQNQNIRSVAWRDKTGPVLYHLLDRLNRLPRSNVVVMAYRNAAQGNDGMIYHARTEVEYAQAKAPNVAVLIGVEVNEVEPAKVTFFGRSYTEISSEVAKVDTEFRNRAAYRGIAINDLAGYQAIGDGGAVSAD